LDSKPKPQRAAAGAVNAAVLERDRELAAELIGWSADQERKLMIYQDLLLRWQRVLNLVSPAGLRHLWTRHIADSAQLLGLAPNALCWADFGSGGGFPGLVLAVLLSERPHALVHLIERDQRKAAFLQTVSRETGAACVVHIASIESVVSTLPVDIEAVTARAVAPLSQLITLAQPLLRRGAVGLFLKGQRVQSEMHAASAIEGMHLSTLPSRTDPSGRIVSVRYNGSGRPDSGAAHRATRE
jgi:16S rRNA (guanine527-N7)-methyltransferase